MEHGLAHADAVMASAPTQLPSCGDSGPTYSLTDVRLAKSFVYGSRRRCHAVTFVAFVANVPMAMDAVPVSIVAFDLNA